MKKIQVGDIIKCEVSGIEDYGFFIKTKNGYSGLVHISEITDLYVKSIYDYVSLGETIKAKIIEVDNTNKKLKLSIKNTEYRIHNSLPADSKEGFNILKEKLPSWKEEKLEEMKKATE